MPDPLLRRREAWEDPDAELGDAARWREENARLGVLPSPSVHESISASSPSGGNGRKGSWIGETLVVEPLEEVRGEEDAQHGVREGDASAGLVVGSVGEESKASVPAPGFQEEDALPAQASQSAEEQKKPSSPPPNSQELDTRRFSMPPENRAHSPQPEQTRSASVAMPSTAARPQPERRTSALDQLPSQQRRRQFTPVGTPRRLSLADGGATVPVPPLDTMPGAEAAQTAPLAGEDGGRQAGPSKISRPPTPANWEMLSFFSAPKPAADAVSRRSSVSSLGDAQSPDVIVTGSKNQSAVGLPASTSGIADEQERNVSPVPVSPIVPNEELSQEDRFMNRSYKTTGQPESRPMSYMPLQRGSSGMPVQEAIGVNQQSNKTYSAASDVGEPHSQGPSRTPSRAPSLGLPQKEYDKLRSPQPGDDEPVPSGANSRRSSGFFRGSDAPPAVGMGPIPTPSRIEDGFNNLEDPQVNEIADDIAKAEQQQQQKHARRKSGIMDTFRRASTHSITATRASSPGSLAKITVANANEGTSVPKSKTLKKLQRAPSSAVESKPKRFSGLGSLFRRSSTHPKSSATPPPTTQAAPAQPTKQAPGDLRAGSQMQPPPQTYPQPTAGLAPKPSRKLNKTPPPMRQYAQPPQQYYPTPPPGNYAAYEAMMRQQGIAPNGRQIPPHYWQQQQQQQQMYMEPAMMSSPYQQQPPAGAYQQQQQQPSGYYQQGPPVGQYQANPSSGQNSRTQSLVGSPVTYQNQPMEYYAVPQGYPAEKTASPEQSQARPQVRRLHSEGHRWVETAPGIPEASSPVSPADEKFGAAAEKPLAGGQAVATEQGSMAQDPPPRQSSPAPTRPHLNTRQSSNYSQASVARSPVSATQPLDNFPQAPGRQDYQTQYWQHQNKPQHPKRSVSPVQTYAVPPTQRQQSHVGSIDQQMARSPAQEYHEQQTPWAISMPASEQENSHRYSSPPPNWPHQSPAHSPQPQYYGPPPAARGAVRSMSPPGPPRRHSQFQDQYSAMTPYHFVPPPQQQYQQRASGYGEQMTTSPATYTPTAPAQQQQQQPQGRSQAQTRYYSQPQQQQQRQVTQQDMEVAREMRAVSYPGQGWEPGR